MSFTSEQSEDEIPADGPLYCELDDLRECAGLMSTTSGGTPYGASHWAGSDNRRAIDEVEIALCRALGQRITQLAVAEGR